MDEGQFAKAGSTKVEKEERAQGEQVGIVVEEGGHELDEATMMGDGIGVKREEIGSGDLRDGLVEGWAVTSVLRK